MKIDILPITEAGPCNYCNKGKLASSNTPKLQYPYSHVFVIKGRSIATNFCEECLDTFRVMVRR